MNPGDALGGNVMLCGIGTSSAQKKQCRLTVILWSLGLILSLI